MMSTYLHKLPWDDLVIKHSAVVDKDGDLVHMGDYLAYQSDGSNTGEMCEETVTEINFVLIVIHQRLFLWSKCTLPSIHCTGD